MAGIDEEDYLMSLGSSLESEFLSAANVPKDTLSKINLVRKGGINWKVPKILLSQIDYIIKKEFKDINVYDATFLLNSIYEDLETISSDDFFHSTMKCIYFEKRFFKLRLKVDIRENIPRVLKTLYNLLISLYMLSNISITGKVDESLKKIRNFMQISNLKDFFNKYFGKVEDTPILEDVVF